MEYESTKYLVKTLFQSKTVVRNVRKTWVVYKHMNNDHDLDDNDDEGNQWYPEKHHQSIFNVLVITVPVNGLASLGATTYTSMVMSIYTGPVLEMLRS